MSRLIDADILEDDMFQLWQQNEISNGEWIQFREILNQQPTAQQWIPCSERLPENEVLCCDVHQTLMIGYVFVSESSNTGYNAESEHEYMYDCIAWMPLPEPMRLENES